MKSLLSCCAVAGLAALSLGLPAHHATPPARAAGRGRTDFALPAQFGAAARRGPGAALKLLDAGAPVKKSEAAPRVDQSAPATAAPPPKSAPKSEMRPDGAAAEGLMVGPDGVIYRREAEAR